MSTLMESEVVKDRERRVPRLPTSLSSAGVVKKGKTRRPVTGPQKVTSRTMCASSGSPPSVTDLLDASVSGFYSQSAFSNCGSESGCTRNRLPREARARINREVETNEKNYVMKVPVSGRRPLHRVRTKSSVPVPMGQFLFPTRTLPPRTVAKAMEAQPLASATIVIAKENAPYPKVNATHRTTFRREEDESPTGAFGDVIIVSSPETEDDAEFSRDSHGKDEMKNLICDNPVSQVSIRGVRSDSCHTFFGPVSTEERENLRQLAQSMKGDDIFRSIDGVRGTGTSAVVRGGNLLRLVMFNRLEDEVVNGIVCLANYRFFACSGKKVFMSSFWYTTLTGGNGVHGSGEEFHYDRIKRWPKSYEIAKLQLMFVPINIRNEHWTLGVVDFVNHRFVYIDSLNDREGREEESKFSEVMRRWLKLAAVDEMGEKRVSVKLKVKRWKAFVSGNDYPQQRDGTSCGVFMLATAISLAAGKTPTYVHRDIVNIRSRLALCLQQNSIREV